MNMHRIGFAARNMTAALMAMAIGCFILMVALTPSAHAYSTAQRGVVVATETVAVQPQYGQYNSYNNVPPQCQQYQYGGGYNSGYNSGTYAGGAIGGAVGYAVGQHSQAGQVLGPVVGAVLGGIIGNHIENSGQQQQAQACYQAQQQANAPSMGQRVLVRLTGPGPQASGQVVSVTVRNGQYGPGEPVWVIGYDHLMPAS